jgi:hypothetical protein
MCSLLSQSHLPGVGPYVITLPSRPSLFFVCVWVLSLGETLARSREGVYSLSQVPLALFSTVCSF